MIAVTLAIAFGLVALGFFLYFGYFTAGATRTDYREFERPSG